MEVHASRTADCQTTEAKQLYAKGWTVNKIAGHLVSNWRSVKRWIEMEDTQADNRGWKKGRLRKYDGKVRDRVLQIRRELRREESYFFGPQVVQANYAHLYPGEKPPTMSFIKTIREAGWMNVARKRDRSSKPSRYMNYPQRALDKLGHVVEGVDFIGPRYIDGQFRGGAFPVSEVHPAGEVRVDDADRGSNNRRSAGRASCRLDASSIT